MNIAACLLVVCLAGCSEQLARQSSVDQASLFDPTGMRIHPIFTQTKDFNTDGQADGVEALIEFQDQFGDATKAAGRVIFELFEYRKTSPDPRGRRLAGPWVASLQTEAEQRSRWDRTSRTYNFQLNDPGIQADRPYVLSAIFELTGGGRFFDRIVLPGRKVEEKEREQFGPSSAPGSRTSQP